MMWVFDPRVAELRKRYHICVRFITDNEDSTLGRRCAKIVKTDSPKKFTLDPLEPALVEIEYTDNKSETRRKFVPPAHLNAETKSSVRVPLVVTSGKHKGKLVHNMRTKGEQVTVRPEGETQSITVAKSILCKLELALL